MHSIKPVNKVIKLAGECIVESHEPFVDSIKLIVETIVEPSEEKLSPQGGGETPPTEACRTGCGPGVLLS